MTFRLFLCSVDDHLLVVLFNSLGQPIEDASKKYAARVGQYPGVLSHRILRIGGQFHVLLRKKSGDPSRMSTRYLKLSSVRR